jgi:hypothetical protein
MNSNMKTLNLGQQAAVQSSHAADAEVECLLNPRGQFKVEHWRGGKRINEYHFPNGITNEGKNKLLDVMFHGTTPITTWFLGMIANAGYTALAATDAYQNIGQAGNGWAEFTDYTDAGNGGSASTRPEWTEGTAATQAISNASPVIFDITATGTVKGLFLAGGTAGAQNKGDHAAGAVLWATALFTVGDVPVNSGDQLKVTYTVSA